MANKEHVAKLKEGAQVWNAWREANPVEPIDLQGANLECVNLQGANLQEASFNWYTLWPEGFDPTAAGARPD